MEFNYIIIGNGIAGYTAAKELNKRCPDCTVAIVSDEKYSSYYRIKMTELIAKDFEVEDTIISPKDWYEFNDITEYLSEPATGIDFDNKEVTLKSGKVIKGGKILLAMGAHSFVPPIPGCEREGVFTLRSIDDLLEFKHFLDGKDRVVVVGGGLLGLEAAKSLREWGKDAIVIENQNHVLARQLNEELGLKLNEDLEDMGITVYAGSPTELIDGDGSVEFVRLEDGTEVKTDAVLLSTGVRPNLSLVEDSPLEINRGIVVNEKMETNLPGIYAAGDVAEVKGTVIGLWTASMDMGKVAAASMCGDEDLEYEEPKLFTRLDLGEKKIFSAGDVSDYDEVYKFDKNKNYYRLFVTDGKVSGAILYGDTSLMNKFKNYVFNHTPILEVKEESGLFND